jgi:fused signal recognition particle receptor
MSSKSSAIGKGILIGAAAGAALYVIWRRSRERHEFYQAPVRAPERPPEAAPEPAQEAFVPAAAEPEPVAEPEPAVVDEPEDVEPEPEPVAETGTRRQGLTYTGRPRDLSPAGWPQPMPLGAAGGVRRPTPVSTRATWPGVAGAGHMRPTPLRRIAPRGGGGPLHRAG